MERASSKTGYQNRNKRIRSDESSSRSSRSHTEEEQQQQLPQQQQHERHSRGVGGILNNEAKVANDTSLLQESEKQSFSISDAVQQLADTVSLVNTMITEMLNEVAVFETWQKNLVTGKPVAWENLFDAVQTIFMRKELNMRLRQESINAKIAIVKELPTQVSRYLEDHMQRGLISQAYTLQLSQFIHGCTEEKQRLEARLQASTEQLKSTQEELKAEKLTNQELLNSKNFVELRNSKIVSATNCLLASIKGEGASSYNEAVDGDNNIESDVKHAVKTMEDLRRIQASQEDRLRKAESASVTTASFEQCEAKRKQLETELQSVRKSLQKLGTQSEERENMAQIEANKKAKEIDCLKREVEHCKRELSELQSKSEESQKKHDSQVENYILTMEDLEKVAQQATVEVQHLSSEVAQMEGSLDCKQKELNYVIGKLECNEKELNALTRSRKTSIEQLNVLAKELENYKKTSTKSATAMQAVHDNAIAQLEHKVVVLQSSNDQLNIDLVAARSSQQSLQSIIETNANELLELHNQYNQVQAKVNTKISDAAANATGLEQFDEKELSLLLRALDVRF